MIGADDVALVLAGMEIGAEGSEFPEFDTDLLTHLPARGLLRVLVLAGAAARKRPELLAEDFAYQEVLAVVLDEDLCALGFRHGDAPVQELDRGEDAGGEALYEHGAI